MGGTGGGTGVMGFFSSFTATFVEDLEQNSSHTTFCRSSRMESGWSRAQANSSGVRP